MGIHREMASQLYIEVEATPGTAVFNTGAPPTSAEILIDAYDIEFSPDWGEFERSSVGGTLQKRPGVITIQKAAINFKCLLKGGSAAGVAPGIGVLFRAAGYSETIVASTSVTYKRVAIASYERFTIGVNKDGQCYSLSGGMLDIVVTCVDGEPVQMECAAMGKWEAPFALAVITPAADTILPPAFKGVGLAHGGDADLVFANLTMNLGNNVIVRQNANDTTGLETALVTDARPTVSIDPELEDIGDKDWFTEASAKAIVDLSWAVGTGAGLICTATAQVAPKAPTFGERDLITILNQELEVVAETDDVEGEDLQFVFT